MRERDRHAIDDLGIPGLVLMENAARGAAEIIAGRLGTVEECRVAILCGRGNNGGDGLAVARHLAILGADPLCILLHSPDQYTADPEVQLRIITASRLCQVVTWDELDGRESFDAVVDALLGTGASGELRPPYADAVAWGNDQEGLKVAIDIPTGIDADTGTSGGVCFDADLTVTMGALKPGLLLGAGSDASGDLYVAHIGAPPEIYLDVSTELLDRGRGRDGQPALGAESNKYDRGKALIVAGSRGMTGAGVMASESALRFGAGLVVFAMPDAAAAVMPQSITPEIMTRLLPSGNDGAFSADAVEAIAPELGSYNVVAVGPGLSKSEAAAAMVRRLVSTAPCPVVLDADGLSAFAGAPEDLRDHASDIIITPHHGEMARLLGIGKEEIAADPLGIARSAAERTGAIVVLKGAPTVVALPNGRAWINGAGNPGMATGGTGDVLTGAIASLVAQTRDAIEGTLAAVFLHSFAADIAVEKTTERGMIATDIIASAGEAYRLLTQQE
jgi:NAD(P)H-hydrate epimerase